MDSDALEAVLSKTLAQQLLRASPLARFAYIAKDGTPRVIPVGYWMDDGKIVFATAAKSEKVDALHERPEVALTIDHDGIPPRALLIRGKAAVEIVDGVPDEYIEASKKSMSGRSASDFGAQVRALYDQMALVTITPTWARLNDFQDVLPKAVEDLIHKKFG